MNNNPAEDLASAVNSGIDIEAFQDDVDAEHNAIQRYLFRQVFKPGIIAIAGTQYVDARNADAVQAAQEICEAMEWGY